MVKSQIVLYIYDKLIRNEKLKIEDVINKYDISIRTFQRYIAEIKAFLCNNFRNEFIEYDIESKYYYLKNNYLE